MQKNPFDNPRYDPLPETPEPEMETLVASADMPAEKKAALQAILAGTSVSRAAKVVGIHRSTLYRWISDDDEFKTALDNYRKLDRAAVREQLLSVVDHASLVIRNAIRCGDVRASFALLRSLKLLPTADTLTPQSAPPSAQTEAVTPAASTTDPPTPTASQPSRPSPQTPTSQDETHGHPPQPLNAPTAFSPQESNGCSAH